MGRYVEPTNKPAELLKHLQSRGLVQDMTPQLGAYLELCQKEKKVPRVYAGFDPSSPSLQIGNVVAALGLRRAQLFGFKPLVLLGGATGLVGDPSGKKEERSLLDKKVVDDNLVRIKNQLRGLLDFEPGPTQAEFVNNYDWFKDFRFLDFLRDVGKYITVNYMIAKESVKIRMETGISYAEFGYMLVQGFDFLQLFESKDCLIQMGGSDQWGNMTTGLELIRRKHQKEAHAFSLPLLTDSAGQKLGKTEAGALYLDPQMTSPFKFYQYWINQADVDVPKLMRFLTLFSDEHIHEVEEKSKAEPEKRWGQKTVAKELTRMIHGEKASESAEKASQVLFSKSSDVLSLISDDVLAFLSQEVPSSKWQGEATLLDLLVQTGLCPSKSEARRSIKSGAVSVNRVKVPDESAKITDGHFESRKFILLGFGKSNLHLVVR